MSEIFEALKNLIIEIINNANYISLISIFVVAFTTYRATKYTSTKPNRMAIKQSQLEKVYLPLFQIFDDVNLPLSIEEAQNYLNKIAEILNKNYVLAFPQLHVLCKELSHNIANNSNYNDTLRIIKHQVNIDYQLLKKHLGYPSENFHDIFIRMTIKQKLLSLLPWIDALWLFPVAILSIILAEFSNLPGLLVFCIMIISAIIMSLVIILLKRHIKNMKD
ncbi:MAG: hypothetical protein IJX30_03105 [Clostridia bacterium]|nr:hypothetical protein [Clostridia bacterium]